VAEGHCDGEAVALPDPDGIAVVGPGGAVTPPPPLSDTVTTDPLITGTPASPPSEDRLPEAGPAPGTMLELPGAKLPELAAPQAASATARSAPQAAASTAAPVRRAKRPTTRTTPGGRPQLDPCRSPQLCAGNSRNTSG
jgi:hypothetical protein